MVQSRYPTEMMSTVMTGPTPVNVDTCIRPERARPQGFADFGALLPLLRICRLLHALLVRSIQTWGHTAIIHNRVWDSAMIHNAVASS